MKGLTVVSLKIMAVYFFVTFIRSGLLSGFYMLFTEEMPLISKLIFVISEVIFLLIIYLLWFKTDYLTERITKNITTEDLDFKNIDHEIFFQVILTLIGIIIIAVSLPELIKYILEMFTFNNIVIIKETPRFIAEIIELLIGIFLVFKSSLLAEYFFNEENK